MIAINETTAQIVIELMAKEISIKNYQIQDQIEENNNLLTKLVDYEQEYNYIKAKLEQKQDTTIVKQVEDCLNKDKEESSSQVIGGVLESDKKKKPKDIKIKDEDIKHFTKTVLDPASAIGATEVNWNQKTAQRGV